MQHQRPTNQTAPLLGPRCPSCADAPYVDGEGTSLPTCRCVLAAADEWKYGPDDRTEWYREAHAFSWRKLSAAEAEMQHAKDAASSMRVRRVGT